MTTYITHQVLGPLRVDHEEGEMEAFFPSGHPLCAALLEEYGNEILSLARGDDSFESELDFDEDEQEIRLSPSSVYLL